MASCIELKSNCNDSTFVISFPTAQPSRYQLSILKLCKTEKDIAFRRGKNDSQSFLPSFSCTEYLLLFALLLKKQKPRQKSTRETVTGIKMAIIKTVETPPFPA